MATGEQNNQALISALFESNRQATASALIVTPTEPSVVATTSKSSAAQSTDIVITLS